ncbi:hypothetical protein SALBM311S_02961 [Streptomyces alboniger]
MSCAARREHSSVPSRLTSTTRRRSTGSASASSPNGPLTPALLTSPVAAEPLLRHVEQLVDLRLDRGVHPHRDTPTPGVPHPSRHVLSGGRVPDVPHHHVMPVRREPQTGRGPDPLCRR